MRHVFASRWYIVFITTIVAIGVAWLVFGQMPDRYRGDALLRLHASDVDEADVPYELDFADRVMNSHATLAESEWMARELLAQLREEGSAGDATVDDLRVVAEIPANTDLMEIQVTHSDPNAAARAADIVAERLAALSRAPVRPPEADADLGPTGGLVLSTFRSAAVPDETVGLGLALTLVLAALMGFVVGTALAYLAAGWNRPSEEASYAPPTYAADRVR